jgi:hypothetical protein
MFGVSIVRLLLFACLLNAFAAALKFGGSRAVVGARADMSLFAQVGRVTMYTKESCPHCKKAKALLEGKYELEVTLVDIEGENR